MEINEHRIQALFPSLGINVHPGINNAGDENARIKRNHFIAILPYTVFFYWLIMARTVLCKIYLCICLEENKVFLMYIGFNLKE
ncbi:hypothetical protein [Chlamydia felis Fe/C-56]|uniref:Uncharacterized protein n=1 Tax=Chlamydia felis (strain Fe/C-56) TaxID=264202 RepID=Q254A4_CHLFF|nr:hypothetical protein [Chlamydia felis Fe/C-56]